MKNLEASEYKTYLETVPLPSEEDKPVLNTQVPNKEQYGEAYQEGHKAGHKAGIIKGFNIAVNELATKRLYL